MITIGRMIPNVWSALWSRHGPQDSNQSGSNKSEKDPTEGVAFLNQLAGSVVSCSWDSTFPRRIHPSATGSVGRSTITSPLN